MSFVLKKEHACISKLKTLKDGGCIAYKKMFDCTV